LYISRNNNLLFNVLRYICGFASFLRVNQIGKMSRGFAYVSLESRRSHRMRNTEKKEKSLDAICCRRPWRWCRATIVGRARSVLP